MVVRRAVPAEAEALWNIRNQAIRHGCRADYPPEVLAASAFTGRGMARQILNAIKQEARQRGMRTLMLSSTPDARDFYLKQGFSVIKEGTYPSSLAGGTLRCFEMICEL
ncbi:GNAT family N-acetyltransferase [Cedecea sp. FDAARGOS_727]|uniref:GNAT family N-acetyltransferase n=1 Tax=Cedecea sp. FDAARGOS_727 TaxID=2545798 RepID=UPI00143EBD4C|nr:GNAT family N-acetyltransferase [Cedecea sp. FDAARGOS_727]QIX97814.1 GNAT family N-acetyltransferase [Cedecea sp. FDAARGOS_727]